MTKRLRRPVSSTISRLHPHYPTNYTGGQCPKKTRKDMTGTRSSRRQQSGRQRNTEREKNQRDALEALGEYKYDTGMSVEDVLT